MDSESAEVINPQRFSHPEQLLPLLPQINQLNPTLVLQRLQKVPNIQLFPINVTLEVLLGLSTELVPKLVALFRLTQKLVQEHDHLLYLVPADVLDLGLVQVCDAVLEVELQEGFGASGGNLGDYDAFEPDLVRPLKQQAQVPHVDAIPMHQS